MANQYDLAVKIAGKVDPSLTASAKKASGLISSIVKADLIASGIKTAANAVKNFAVSSVQSYASFEQSLANAGAIAGATGEDLQAMKDAAMEAGRTTQFTAAQSADALGYMALAGWDTKTSIQALTPVLKLAQATGADLATTSDQVTDSMSAMGIGVNDLNNYLDVLVMTNNKSNTTAAALMEAMIAAGSASKAAGMDYKQTATALGVLANNGIKGAEAGTALNSMLMRMTSNKAAIKQYRELGVRVFDAKGKMRDFETILKETDKALSKLSDEKRSEAIKEIAGVNYGGQYQFLLKGVRAAADGSTEWGKLYANIKGANGALETMNAKATDTVTGAWFRFQSAIDGARLALIDKFGPDIKNVLDFVSNNVIPPLTNAIGAVATKIASLIQFAKDVYHAFIDVKTSAVDAGSALTVSASGLNFIAKYGRTAYDTVKQILEILRSVKAGFEWITDVKARMQDLNNLFYEHKEALEYAAIAIGGLGAAILAYNAKAIAGAIAQGVFSLAVGIYTGTISVATIATSAFGAVLAFITSPITLVVAAITGLILAGVWLYNNWDMVKAKAVELWNSFAQKFPWIANLISSYWGFVIDVFKQWWQTVQTCWGYIKNIFSNIIDFVCNVFTGNWSNAWQNVVNIFSNVFGMIKTAAKAPLNGVIWLINKAIESLNTFKVSVPEGVPGIGGKEFGFNIAPIPALAAGGIATKATTALIGEGSESEAILPLSKLDALLNRERDTSTSNLTDFLNSAPPAQTFGGDNITFSPVINITGGNGSSNEIQTAVDTAFEQFKRMYEQLQRDKRRVSFSR